MTLINKPTGHDQEIASSHHQPIKKLIKMQWFRYNLLLGTLLLLSLSCQNEKKEDYRTLVKFDKVQNYVIENLESAIDLLEQLKYVETSEEGIEIFRSARLAFKKAEPFGAYLSADNTLRVNGPPLPVFSEDSGMVFPPTGLQAIEETLFEVDVDKEKLLSQITVSQGFMRNILRDAQELKILPRRYFPSMHQQLLRIYALGLSGFDTPTSLWGIDESIVCLNSMKEVYQMGVADTIALLNKKLNFRFVNDIDKAIAFIENNKNFETFDRYTFGREHLNALTRDWVEIRKTFGFEPSKNAFALNMDAPTFFESNSFNEDFFRLSYNRNPTKEIVELGKSLFHDKRLSATGDLACVTCHDPGLAYQDGLKVARGKEGMELQRNTPTIINTIYQKKFFWDGTADGLQNQITSVFDNENEFDSNAHSILTNKILEDSTYIESIKKAFPTKKINRTVIVRALAAYTSTLNAMNSRFDKNMRGELDDFTEQEVLGMNLYMGKALCATCHFVPLTNGTVPPLFLETEKEIIGVPKTAKNKELDDDVGFYPVFKADIHKFMFKTPTMRNAEVTAPYMHNGVYNTLEEVMNFYNLGGGGGMGFDLEHQTLPFDNLQLSEKEIKALVAFTKTLTDTDIKS
jgi:cytochrome c peroxidase